MSGNHFLRSTDFYDIDISYDRNSNITVIENNVHTGFDVSYTMDDVDRLTRAQEGTWGGSSISSETRDQEWTLDQVGNWDLAKLDLNGDDDWSGTDEYEDDRTHNKVNELTGRDIDDSGSDDYTLVYDEVGNLIDDGASYKYVYDPMGRLREVLDRSDDSLVAEYKYNGVKYRVSEHVDTDDDGDVDGSDDWWHYAFDTRWRMLSKYVGSASDPEEEFVYQRAGRDGQGRSTYIDELALRDRDTTGNGTLDERIYYCQNWRADVSALVDDAGAIVEWVKYSAYGVPFGLPGGDTDSDGDCDSTDEAQVTTWVNASTYDVIGDLDLDGDVDSVDESAVNATYLGLANGWNRLGALVVGNKFGFAGYGSVGWSPSDYACRHRTLVASLGRWSSRDPLGYQGLANLVEYAASKPTVLVDPFGLVGQVTNSGATSVTAVGEVPNMEVVENTHGERFPPTLERPDGTVTTECEDVGVGDSSSGDADNIIVCCGSLFDGVCYEFVIHNSQQCWTTCIDGVPRLLCETYSWFPGTLQGLASRALGGRLVGQPQDGEQKPTRESTPAEAEQWKDRHCDKNK
jgi:RHS repeat-associated protein